jgi:hypothetical protein
MTKYILLMPPLSLFLVVIALNLTDENQRVHERVNALTHLSSFDEVFLEKPIESYHCRKVSRSGATGALIF